MTRFLSVLAAFALAGAIYVATAPGGQTASPTAKQFKALQKQVTKLQKDETKVKALASAEVVLLTDCMAHAVPIDQFGDGSSYASTTGYSYVQPDLNNGAAFNTTALDVTSADPLVDPNALWITGGGAACGTDLNAAVRKVARLTGIRLHVVAPQSFTAHKP